MNQNKKLIIQGLALVIFGIVIYQNWGDVERAIFYTYILCFFEILVNFVYLLINKNKLTKDLKDNEIIQILVYLIIVVAIYLIRSLFVMK